MRIWIAAAAMLATAAAPPAEHVDFIACPIYRDTDNGQKSGCWLADDAASGRRFHIGLGPSKPEWGRMVLVEGRVAEKQENLCGGVTLDPIRVSVLDQECPRNVLLPEGYTGYKYYPSKRDNRPLTEPRPPIPQPYADRDFNVFFDFDHSYLLFHLDDMLIDKALNYIRVAKPKRVIVTGYAATGPRPISGQSIAESPQTARDRAEMVAEALTRLGVSRDLIVVRWEKTVKPVDDEYADGMPEVSLRRATISVKL